MSDQHSYHRDNSGVPQYGTEEYNHWYRSRFGPTSLTPSMPPRKPKKEYSAWRILAGFFIGGVLVSIAALFVNAHSGSDSPSTGSTSADASAEYSAYVGALKTTDAAARPITSDAAEHASIKLCAQDNVDGEIAALLSSIGELPGTSEQRGEQAAAITAGYCHGKLHLLIQAGQQISDAGN